VLVSNCYSIQVIIISLYFSFSICSSLSLSLSLSPFLDQKVLYSLYKVLEKVIPLSTISIFLILDLELLSVLCTGSGNDPVENNML